MAENPSERGAPNGAARQPDQSFHLTVFTAGLAADAQQGVRALAAAAQRSDGSPPYSDQTLLSLAKPEGVYGVLALIGAEQEQGQRTAAGELAGQQVIGAAVIADGVFEMATHPDHRAQGVATNMLRTLTNAFPTEQLLAVDAWRHGSDKAADRFAIAYDFRPVRELWKMSVPADHPFPEPRLAPGVRLRTFVPGEDDEPWLRLNAAAFAEHPEQGKMTLQDLHARQAEDWFDADGFFLAENSGGQLLAFHWTKTVAPASPADQRVGEVYVVGVSPDAQGQGLGLALTLAGLQHLRDRVDVIELYVDADNVPAVGLYQKLGFARATVDVMYRHSSRAS